MHSARMGDLAVIVQHLVLHVLTDMFKTDSRNSASRRAVGNLWLSHFDDRPATAPF